MVKNIQEDQGILVISTPFLGVLTCLLKQKS